MRFHLAADVVVVVVVGGGDAKALHWCHGVEVVCEVSP